MEKFERSKNYNIDNFSLDHETQFFCEFETPSRWKIFCLIRKTYVVPQLFESIRQTIKDKAETCACILSCYVCRMIRLDSSEMLIKIVPRLIKAYTYLQNANYRESLT